MPLNNPQRAKLFFLGLGAATGFAPLFLWPMTALCFWAFFKHINQHRHLCGKHAFKQGWWFGFGFCVLSFWWVAGSFRFTPFGPKFLVVGVFATLALSAIMALWVALPTAGLHAAYKKIPQSLMPLAAAALWVGVEALRTTTPYGFGWNLLGYIFAGHSVLMQPAALGGVWLLSAFAVIGPHAFVGKLKPSVIALYLTPIFATFAWGAHRLYTAPPLTPFAQVTLIQPNINQAEKWHLDPLTQAATFADAIEELEQQGENTQKATLVILPETALTFIDPEHMFMQTLLSKHLHTHPQSVIYGSPTKLQGAYYNSIVSLTGTEAAVFSKQLLVPFGEGLPLRGIIPTTLVQYLPTFYSPSKNPRTLPTAIGTALPLICYEAIFPHHIKKAQRLHQPRFILNLTNDAWFDGTTGPEQHFAIAKFRSVETGLSQVRVANTGISAVIDGYGRIIKRSKKRQYEQIDSPIFEQVRKKNFFGIAAQNNFSKTAETSF